MQSWPGNPVLTHRLPLPLHREYRQESNVPAQMGSREESGGVIEDGDVGAGSIVDQVRGSEEGDTAWA